MHQKLLIAERAANAAAIIAKDAALTGKAAKSLIILRDRLVQAIHKVCRAATLLQNEGVVAYPTEAVWGLGCDPWSEAAVGKILQIKTSRRGQRPYS